MSKRKRWGPSDPKLGRISSSWCVCIYILILQRWIINRKIIKKIYNKLMRSRWPGTKIYTLQSPFQPAHVIVIQPFQNGFTYTHESNHLTQTWSAISEAESKRIPHLPPVGSWNHSTANIKCVQLPVKLFHMFSCLMNSLFFYSTPPCFCPCRKSNCCRPQWSLSHHLTVLWVISLPFISNPLYHPMIHWEEPHLNGRVREIWDERRYHHKECY